MSFAFFLFFIFLFGLIIGSFLNALIWRLHSGESMMDRSKCPKCAHQIVWYDNIPLLSYLLLRGKCRHCQRRISWQYPLVELTTALLFGLAFYFNYQSSITNYELISLSQTRGSWSDVIMSIPSSLSPAGEGRGEGLFAVQSLISLFRDFFLIAVMIIIFIYDLRWYLILDVVTLPAMAVMLFLNFYLGFAWQDLLISALIGGGFFLVQFVISQGRWIGGGDIRLGFLMGLALGWPQIIAALMLAYSLGAFVGVVLIIFSRKKWDSQIPFGVFLTTATIIILFWGDFLVQWYWGLVGLT